MKTRITAVLCLFLSLSVSAHACGSDPETPAFPTAEVEPVPEFPAFRPVFRLWIPGDSERTGYYRLNFSPFGGETLFAAPETKPAIETLPILR